MELTFPEPDFGVTVLKPVPEQARFRPVKKFWMNIPSWKKNCRFESGKFKS
jgi:hypothetical protein